ncbi:hypothetical protein, partial [Streptomyces sp. NPDC051577]|uniref:hypothetical protein n=1 Tax=Streptomyces sp. NPDC051577 TaxID=3155166 RepID=UPI0034494061
MRYILNMARSGHLLAFAVFWTPDPQDVRGAEDVRDAGGLVAGAVRVSRLRRTDARTALWNGGSVGATRRLNSDNRQDVFSVMRRVYPARGRGRTRRTPRRFTSRPERREAICAWLIANDIDLAEILINAQIIEDQ